MNIEKRNSDLSNSIVALFCLILMLSWSNYSLAESGPCSYSAANTACVAPTDGCPLYVDACLTNPPCSPSAKNCSADHGSEINAAILMAAAANVGIVFAPNKVYQTSIPIVIQHVGGPNGREVPEFVDGNGSTLIAISGVSSCHPNASICSLVNLELVNGRSGGGTTGPWTGAELAHFRFKNFVLDGAGRVQQVLTIRGGKYFELTDVEIMGGKASGLYIASKQGFGVYYSTIRNVISRNNGTSESAVGIEIATEDNLFSCASENEVDWQKPKNRTANILFHNVISKDNTGDGYRINFVNTPFLGISSTGNGGFGVNIKNTQAVDFFSATILDNGLGAIQKMAYSDRNPITGKCEEIGTRRVSIFGGILEGAIVGNGSPDETNPAFQGVVIP